MQDLCFVAGSNRAIFADPPKLLKLRIPEVASSTIALLCVQIAHKEFQEFPELSAGASSVPVGTMGIIRRSPKLESGHIFGHARWTSDAGGPSLLRGGAARRFFGI